MAKVITTNATKPAVPGPGSSSKVGPPGEGWQPTGTPQGAPLGRAVGSDRLVPPPPARQYRGGGRG